MKKIISAILSLCMLMSMVTVSAKSTDTTLRATTAEQARLLEKLEIMDTAPSADEYSQKLTRAEFIMYLANITGVWNNKEAKRYFDDVPMDHWAADAINELFEMDIISRDEAKNFRPKDKITVGEATKLVVVLLGYGKYAELSGTFPQNYMNTADYLGIHVGGASKEMTKEDAVDLLYQTIQAPFGDEKSDDGGHRTILSYYFHVYSYEGYVREASGISLDGEANMNSKIVKIDNEEFISSTDLADYLGRKISFFYRQETSSADPEIIHLVSGKDKSKTLTISTAEFNEYENGEISYTEDGAIKSRKIKVPAGAVIVKNGTVESKNITKAFEMNNGTIKCVDIDGDGVYDYFFLWDYVNLVVNRKNSEQYRLYDKMDAEHNVVLDPEEKKVYISNANGAVMTFDQIAKGNIVSVYESANYVKAVVRQESNTGTVQSVNYDEDEHTISLGKSVTDKNEYHVEEVFWNTYLNPKNASSYKLDIGTDITYWLDASGKLAYIDFAAVKGNWQLGYLIRTFNPEDDDERVGMKLYTEAGVITNYLLADRVTVDGTSCKYDEVKAAINKETKYKKSLTTGEDPVNGQILRFRLNNDGEIRALDTEYSNDEKEGTLNLHRSQSRQSLFYRWNSHSFEGKFVWNGGAKVFIVPDHADLKNADLSQFKLTSGGYFGDYYYNVEAFRMNSTSGSEDVLVVYGTVSGSWDKQKSLVEKVYQAIDKEDQVKWYADVYVLSNGSKRTLVSEDTEGFLSYDKDNNPQYNAFEPGDVIQFCYNAKDEIQEISIVYDYSVQQTNPSYGWLTGFDWGESVCIANAFVKYIDDSMISISFSPLSKENYAPNSGFQAAYNAVHNSGSVLIAERKNGKFTVSKGSWEDVLPADADGYENAQSYLLFTWVSIFYGAVVYR